MLYNFEKTKRNRNFQILHDARTNGRVGEQAAGWWASRRRAGGRAGGGLVGEQAAGGREGKLVGWREGVNLFVFYY